MEQAASLWKKVSIQDREQYAVLAKADKIRYLSESKTRKELIVQLKADEIENSNKKMIKEAK